VPSLLPIFYIPPENLLLGALLILVLGLITGGDFVTGQTLIVDGGLSLS